MIRVAVVTSRFPSREHPYIWDWLTQLHSKGVNITVITEHFEVYDGFHLEKELLGKVICLNTVTAPLRSVFLNWGGMLHSLVRFQNVLSTLEILSRGESKRRTITRKLFEYLPILGCRFDVVHFNAAQIAVRRFELGRIWGARTLVSFRGQDFTFHPARYDSLLRQADHLHFISEHLIQEAYKREYDGSKHSLIPPMVDTEFYYPNPSVRKVSDRSHFVIFTAARMSWTKGYEFALLAIAFLLQEGVNVHYYIAGDGELSTALGYTVRDLGLEGRVHLLGWLSPAEVRQWLWKSDLYLLASVEEAFNNSVLQAQACGVPVVCSDTGGLPENVADGETGLVARRRDARDLAEKMSRLLMDPQERQRMGRRASERVRKQFALSLRVADFVELYKRLVCHGSEAIEGRRLY